MLKLFVRFLTAMIVVAGIYLVFVNSSYTSLQKLQNKKKVIVKFQNFPEIILPLRGEIHGYQYELLKSYLNSINKNSFIEKNNNYDIEIFYSSMTCETCVVVKDEDLLLVSNNENNNNNDIEVSLILKNIELNNNIIKNYQINYTNNELDVLVYNLSNNLISHTILTRSTYLFFKKYYPNLVIKKNITKVNLLWNFSKDDGTLRNNLFEFLENGRTLDFISDLNKKYYSKNSMSSYIFIGSRIFISDIVLKLPNFEHLFRKASMKYNIDWKLLAALSYQESKWDNDAVSPTGVRGLMMLTKQTADMLEVNRLIPSESIDGGAKYLVFLRNKYKKYNNETQLNLMLASYNLGSGHVDDVISLLTKDNIDINNWNNLRKYLFKLNKKKFYKKMQYGYARGWEAVQYIENVKQYYDIISFLEEKDKKIKDNITIEVPNAL
jgi:membrane-bound lytic murein transglycosylase MltF